MQPLDTLRDPIPHVYQQLAAFAQRGRIRAQRAGADSRITPTHDRATNIDCQSTPRSTKHPTADIAHL